MKLLYKYKYKIYRRFQSEIWGNIILSKKHNNLYKFILDNFNYNLKKFYKGDLLSFIKYLKILKYRRKDNSRFFFKRFFIKNSPYLLKNVDKKIFNFRNNQAYSLIKYSYSIFWLNLFNIYSNINFSKIFLNKTKKKNYFFNTYNFQKKYELKLKTILFLAFLRKKIIKKKIYKYNLLNRFPKRIKNFYFKKRHKFNKYNIYDHLMSDYMYTKKNFYFKKKRSTWWNLKIEQDRANIFFGFFSRKKFLRFQQALFYTNKLRLNWILTLVGRLGFILYQMNIFTNMYYIYNFVKRGYVFVNKKKKLNPNYDVALLDNISFDKRIFKRLYFSFKFRLKNNKILINSPKYLEINYKILAASIWRLPRGDDVIGPLDFPFKTFNYDWLIYKKYP